MNLEPRDKIGIDEFIDLKLKEWKQRPLTENKGLKSSEHNILNVIKQDLFINEDMALIGAK
jgi:hypothetical protein